MRILRCNFGMPIVALNLWSQLSWIIAPSNVQTWKELGQVAKSCAASSFGLSTAAAGGAVAAGMNTISTAGKFAGMTRGTSVASSFFRAILPQVAHPSIAWVGDRMT
jgi:hypothetical protein